MDIVVALFTRDLRVRDNPVLATAARDADHVVPLFVLDDVILAALDSPNRLGFLLDSLTDLDQELQRRGAHLVVRRGHWVQSVLDVAAAAGAQTIHVARDVSGFAQGRLERLERAAAAQGVTVAVHESVTVVPPGELQSSSAGPFLVFTPYYKRWLAHPWRALIAVPRRISAPNGVARGDIPTLETLTKHARGDDIAPGGESEGVRRLRRWTSTRLVAYKEGHDDLPGDRTSRISPYVHFGCLSALEVATRLRNRPGGDAFARQLCWRDFYAQLLAARPDTSHRDVRDTHPTWSTDQASADAWRTGRTGYPVVDAAMRQLVREGWMHNRARMVVASFLTKDLMIDWRTGAAFFMQHLVDGDVAQNQLNWQWVAGTGTDTNPHRVYNPTVQSRKFDRDGVYIRRYVAELAGVEGDIHDPPSDERTRVGYPEPIVDHKPAIEAWRAARAR